MKKGWKITLLAIFVLLITLLIVRANTSRQIDDVSPGIPCEEEYLEKVDILWIIPNFQGISISENKEWCKEILSLNKKLEMHGVQHYFNEFEDNLSQEYFQEGLDTFEECFGYPPTMFKPPKLKLSKQNKELLENNNLDLRRYSNQIFHKVYHCNNTGTLPNKFHDLF